MTEEHDENDNNMSPWDIAAASPMPVTTRLTHNNNNNNNNNNNIDARIPSHYFCCSRRNIQKTLQLWICFDICLTVGLLTCLWLEPKRHRSFDWVAGVAAALLGLRSVWSCCGFSTDWVCERSTLLWSARISWILIAVASGGAILFLTVAHAPPPYGHDPTRRIALQIWLWMITVMECIRFFLLRYYYRFQVQRDRDDLQRSLLDHEASLRRRPWWWEGHENISRHDIREPFLPDGLEWTRENPPNHHQHETSFFTTRQSQTGESSSSWWDSVFFWRGGGGDSQHDLRDEGSVDFVSVQDEWASRSEQDPYWWSRDETETQHQEPARNKTTSSTLPTWIQTTLSVDPPKLQRNNSHSSSDE
ncbi:hypothetical protein FisN_24Lh047 [Fistulifera solaris]|uniref:Transmembrane protein n=1 Tax=Fistulifera solaris TaxID=1519565 RepID=A0A1Z5KTC6_FISSO|nr:hypothetical protein FisN_24Lh047 [Fistulifera solaris]|eukprot:GAX29590.1 hypothetical protein FisN_24Lh047 [Fistulifera solaris]